MPLLNQEYGPRVDMVESVIPPGPPTHKMLFSCRQTFRCYLYSSIAQKVPLSPDLLPMLVWHVDHALT